MNLLVFWNGNVLHCYGMSRQYTQCPISNIIRWIIGRRVLNKMLHLQSYPAAHISAVAYLINGNKKMEPDKYF